ncbi:MAG TPA: response regulator transcription factor [Gemmatimonadaceae bacterium]|nr:response regulator transcription factor [Gemmatimonadaceae bacterium]
MATTADGQLCSPAKEPEAGRETDGRGQFPNPLMDVEVPVPSVPDDRRPVRVLVVDAHPLMRAGIRAVIASMRDAVLVGEGVNDAEALRLAESTRPDVVLLDIDALDDGGFAAMRALTASDPHPRVVALTILSEDETLVQVLRAGASGLISKDSAEEDLAAAVRAAASHEVYVRPPALRLLTASVRRRLPSPAERAARAQFDALSERERAVLEQVATGLTGPEIGQRLQISAKTVDTYRHRIREKLGLLHRADYIRFALLIGLLKN